MSDECSHEPMDEHLAKVRANILKYGWHVTGVLDKEPFAYTVGLTRFEDHPELVMTSLDPRQAQGLLNLLGQQVQAGHRLRPGLLHAEQSPIQDFDCWLIPVDDWESHPLAVAHAIYSRRITALQVVWPDASGLFPWQEGYNHIGCPQPLLGPTPGI